MARRNKLLGLWAAGELKLLGSEADAYARAVAEVGLVAKGADPAVEKVRNDFHSANIAIPDNVVRRKLEEFHQAARDGVLEDK